MLPVSWRYVLALGLVAALAAALVAYRAARPDAAATPAPEARALPSPNAEAEVTLPGTDLPERAADIFTVEMTAYNSVPAQTDSTPNVTASGAKAAPGTVAVSRDLLERFPYGSEIAVLSVSGPGCGGYVPETPLTVADTMNARIRHHLDVWLETPRQARNWGRCRADIRAP